MCGKNLDMSILLQKVEIRKFTLNDMISVK